MLVRTREFDTFIAPDGLEYDLHVPTARWVISQSGWGTPPIQYITEHGPFQHGDTVKDFFLRPRTIQMLVRQNFCDRDAYWGGRAALLNAIRPNRQLLPTATVPGTLCRRLSTGEQRCLDVFITEGPRFEPREAGRWDEFSFQEVLRFTAFNPVIYDPIQQSANFVLPSVIGELVFPITFPIIFGASQINETQMVNYVGTWEEYPIIMIDGPLDEVVITNQTTGEVLHLQYSIATGGTVTFDLRYGFKTVTDNLGNNLIGSLTSDSDLATWHLAPDPEAPGGVNTINVVGVGADPNTAIRITWFSRYFGI